MIWVDNDAAPRAILDVLFRASRKREVPVTLVANRWRQPPKNPFVEQVVVSAGADVADDWIADHCGEGDLVITADIPLAARVVEKGAKVLKPRGGELTAADVREALSMRDFAEELRSAGIDTGGAKPFGPKDVQHFSNGLDRWITKWQQRRDAAP